MTKQTSDGPFYPFFDYLRAACAIAVVLSHEGLLGWQKAGNFSVQVFFALSGWLIGGILLKLQPSELPRFYFNRALRIWAPYYLCALILLTLSILREPVTAKWIEIVIYKITFVYNWFGTPQLDQFAAQMPQRGTLSHFWSVNVEEQFYLLAPLLLILLPRYGKTVVLWTVVAGVALVFDLYASIAFGVLAVVIQAKFGSFHLGSIGRSTIVFVLLAASFSMAKEGAYELCSPFAALSIVLLLAVPGKKLPGGELLGGMSYPLYLNQWIGGFVSNFLFKTSTPLVRHSVAIALGILIAMAMYWWFDRILLSKRKAWYNAKRGLVVTALAYGLVLIGIIYGLSKNPLSF